MHTLSLELHQDSNQRIQGMEDEDDHVLEWNYIIDHVYWWEIIKKNKFTLVNVCILSTKENIMEFFNYLFRKSNRNMFILRR